MKDSVILEGKEYISSRQVAEMTRYSQDYVGQLSRQGFVRAKLIGRSWFVEKESILEHLQKNALDQSRYPQAPEAAVPAPVSEPEKPQPLMPAPGPAESEPIEALVAEAEAEDPFLPKLISKNPIRSEKSALVRSPLIAPVPVRAPKQSPSKPATQGPASFRRTASVVGIFALVFGVSTLVSFAAPRVGSVSGWLASAVGSHAAAEVAAAYSFAKREPERAQADGVIAAKMVASVSSGAASLAGIEPSGTGPAYQAVSDALTEDAGNAERAAAGSASVGSAVHGWIHDALCYFLDCSSGAQVVVAVPPASASTALVVAPAATASTSPVRTAYVAAPVDDGHPTQLSYAYPPASPGLTSAEAQQQIDASIESALAGKSFYSGTPEISYAPVYQQISDQSASAGAAAGDAISATAQSLTTAYTSAIAAAVSGGSSDFDGSALSVSTTTTGSLALSNVVGSTQCLHVNAEGVVSGTGSDCGSGAGSGTVGSGTTGQLAYYPSDGTAVSGISTSSLGLVTSVGASGGATGLSFTGGPITGSGTLTLAGDLAVASGGTGTTTAPSFGQLLVGNGAGAYSLVSTSSLGIAGTNYFSNSGSTTTLATGSNLLAGLGDFGNLISTSTLAVTATTTSGSLKVTGSTTLASSLSGLLFATSSGVVSSLANGSNGQILQSTGSGEHWVATSSLGIAGTPAGSSGQIQFNSGGSFGGNSGLTWDGTELVANQLVVGNSAIQIDSSDDVNFNNDGNNELLNYDTQRDHNTLSFFDSGDNVDAMDFGSERATFNVNVGFGGQVSPGHAIDDIGDFRLAQGFFDSTDAQGAKGQVLESTGTSTLWVATSSLGIAGSNYFSNSGATTTLNTGTALAASAGTFGGLVSTSSLAIKGTIIDESGSTGSGGNCLLDAGGGVQWSACPNSVANSDGTLTVTPTTGNVMASLNLTHANIWTGKQTFNLASSSILTVGGTEYVGNLVSTSTATSTFAGAIGIGTSSPSNALEVAGNGFFSGSLTAAAGTFGSVTATSTTATSTFFNIKVASSSVMAPVYILHSNGTEQMFYPTSTTSAAYGAAFVSALQTAVASDTIYLAAGLYNTDAYQNLGNILQPAAGVTIVGASPYTTVIEGDGDSNFQVLFAPANNDVVENVGFQVDPSMNSQAVSVVDPSSSAQNGSSTLINVVMNGYSDDIYYEYQGTGTHSTLNVYNSSLSSNFDNVEIGGTASHVLNLYDDTLTSSGSYAGGNAYKRNIADYGGVVNVYGSHLNEAGFSESSGAIGIFATSSSAIVNSYYTDIVTSNNGAATPYDLYNGGGAAINAYYDTFNSSKTFGTINVVGGSYFSNSGATTTLATGSNLASTLGVFGSISATSTTATSTIADSLGIGTASPLDTLTVAGAVGINPFMVASSSGAKLLSLLQNGDFGIGTSSPSNALEVAGNGFFSGNLTATGTLSVSGQTTLASSLTGLLFGSSGVVSSLANGSSGSVLESTGSGEQWVATSSLGISGTNFFSNSGATTTLATGSNLASTLGVFGSISATSSTATSTIAQALLVGEVSPVSTTVKDNRLEVNNGSEDINGHNDFLHFNDTTENTDYAIGTDANGRLAMFDPVNNNPSFDLSSFSGGTAGSRLAGLLIETGLVFYAPGSTFASIQDTTNNHFLPLGAQKVIVGNTLADNNTSHDNGSGASVQINASSTIGGSLWMGGGTAPTSPQAGQMYYSTGSSTMYGYNGSKWGEMVFPDITDITAGKVGIGTTSPGSMLDVDGNITDESVDNCNGGGGGLGTTATGTVFCQVSFSDERLKTGVASLDPADSLSLVDSLNPVSFYWKDPSIPGTNSTQEQFGFIAQQVQSVAPNLVATTSPTYLTPGGTLYLDYQGIIPLLANAIQGQQAEIGSATSSLSALTVGQGSLAAAASTTEVTVASLSAGIQSLSASLAAASSTFAEEIAAIASSTVSASTLASSTASALSTSQSFIQTIADAVLVLLEQSGEAVSSAGSWSVHQVSAAFASFTDVKTSTIEAETASVTNGIEMTDQVTGQVYCVQIVNGSFAKYLGACSASSTLAEEDEQPLPVQNAPAPASDPNAPASSSASAATASSTDATSTQPTASSTPSTAAAPAATSTAQAPAATASSTPASAVADPAPAAGSDPAASSTPPVSSSSDPDPSGSSSGPGASSASGSSSAGSSSDGGSSASATAAPASPGASDGPSAGASASPTGSGD